MFAELVCGPPGSGKTTYCEGKRQFLSIYDPQRPVVMMNLDPANDGVFPYPCDVDVRMLVDHARVMETEGLGPNGSYLFSLDVIGERLDWLEAEIRKYVELRIHTIATSSGGGSGGGSSAQSAKVRRAPHLIIDAPGQVEFYLNSDSMHRFVNMLQKRLRCSTCMVHLADGVVATRDVPTYISTCLLSLSAMVDLELPHVNILTKWDLVLADAQLTPDGELDAEAFLETPMFLEQHFNRMWKRRGPLGLVGGLLPQDADADTEVGGGVRNNSSTTTTTAPAASRANDTLLRMSRTILDVIDGFGIVGFVPLDVQSQELMMQVVQRVDNAMGNFV